MSFNHEYPYVDPNRSNADWLLNKVKEFASELDSWKETILKLEEALKDLEGYDARISALEEAVNTLNPLISEVAALEGSLEALYRNDDRINARIDAIVIDYDLVLKQLDRISNLFVPYYEMAKAYTDREVYKLWFDMTKQFGVIENEIAELNKLRPMELTNPADASVNDLQTSYNKAYADMRDDALTVSQFSGLGITVDEFEDLGLRAKEFMLHGFTIFHKNFVTAPVSGLLKPVSHALSELLNFIVGSFTVSEFEALDLDSDAFDALDYTVIDFLLANDANRGLTVEGFNDIIISGGSNILRLE